MSIQLLGKKWKNSIIRGDNMQKKDRVKNILLIVLALSLIGLSVAYATLTQYLYINSQTIIGGQSAGWRVEFTAVTCHTTGNASITHDFTMTSTNLSGLISKFARPGDSVVCNIKVTNNGIINAKLSSFEIQDGSLTYAGSGANKTADEALVSGKVQHSIVYGAGDPQEGQTPQANDTLAAGVTRDLVLTVTYPSSATLPDNDVTVSGLQTTFLYYQN
jgi:hypothetical protein